MRSNSSAANATAAGPVTVRHFHCITGGGSGGLGGLEGTMSASTPTGRGSGSGTLREGDAGNGGTCADEVSVCTTGPTSTATVRMTTAAAPLIQGDPVIRPRIASRQPILRTAPDAVAPAAVVSGGGGGGGAG